MNAFYYSLLLIMALLFSQRLFAESETYLCRTHLLKKLSNNNKRYINLNFRDFSQDTSKKRGIAYRNPYFFVEGKKSTISVNVAISKNEYGWYFSYQAFRLIGDLDQKYFSNPWRKGNKKLTKRFELNGAGKREVIFENYKLKVNCRMFPAY